MRRLNIPIKLGYSLSQRLEKGIARDLDGGIYVLANYSAGESGQKDPSCVFQDFRENIPSENQNRTVIFQT